VVDGKCRNAGRVHPERGDRRGRRVDRDGSARTRQDPQGVPRQRQRLRAQKVAGARLVAQELMMRQATSSTSTAASY